MAAGEENPFWDSGGVNAVCASMGEGGVRGRGHASFSA